MSFQLRPYQAEAVEAVFDHWRAGGGDGLIELPTAAGKSLVIATICQRLLNQYPRLRIGIVTHVKELVEQNMLELIRLWPGAPVGIYSAGLGRRDTRARILFMGIQSVHRKTELLGDFDVLLIDEAHLLPRDSATMYGRFIERCRDRVPDMRLLGLTATPYRLDSGRLDRGEGAMFDGIIYSANVWDLIEQGYLSRLTSKAAATEIDVSHVHVRGGEFVPAELEAMARIPTVVEAAVRELCELGRDRRGWIAFCSGVEHALQVRDEIRRHGVSCETITGDTAPGVRAGIIRRFKAREIRCLTSVAVLTTGFNAPHVDLVALMRPTLSTGLYVQMVGRGFRLAEGKDDCLVLDYAGNVRRHGPVDMPNPSDKRAKAKEEGDEEAPEYKVKADSIMAKQCPDCRTLCALNVMSCVDCGFEWPKPPPRHEAKAAVVAVLSKDQPPPPSPWHDVTETIFFRHEKPGGRPTIRVEYRTGMTAKREWWCPEHSGFQKEKTGMKWRRLGGDLPDPESVDEMLDRIAAGELCQITAIKLKPRPGSKYEDVASYRVHAEERTSAANVPELAEVPF